MLRSKLIPKKLLTSSDKEVKSRPLMPLYTEIDSLIIAVTKKNPGIMIARSKTNKVNSVAKFLFFILLFIFLYNG